MLSELVVSLVIMTILVAAMAFILFLILNDVGFISSHINKKSLQREIHMILEGDFFIRRKTSVYRATSLNRDKHILAFWESTQNKRKFVFYHILLKKDSDLIRIIDRYAISKKDIDLSDNKEYIYKFIEDLKKGIYCKPLSLLEHYDFNALSRLLCETRFYSEDGLYLIDTGVHKYYFP